MVKNVQDEADVGLYTLNLHFFKCSYSLVVHVLEGSAMSDDLYKKAVVVRRDNCSCEAVTAVKSDAEAGRASILSDCTCVRCKIIGRILGSYTQLNRMSVQLDVVLALDVDLLRVKGISLCNQNLCSNEVNTCYHLRDRMLYLDSCIHLDEVVVAVLVE